MKIVLFLIFLGFGAANSYAQSTGAWSMQFRLPELTEIVNLPAPIEKIEQLLEDERSSKAFIFAAGIETSLSPATHGQWDTIPARGYVWRLGIRAENAQSLNLFIENYRLHLGMALYVHGDNTTVGPFDASNGGVLPVQSLSGDMVIVEWNIPQASQRNYFTITNVGYGFRDMGRIARQSQLWADHCNIDVNCKTGNHWQRESRSVVLMETVLMENDGRIRWQRCTGTLINQAVEPHRKRPYILTANHCISTPEHALNTIFIFGYEKPYCDGPNITRPTTGLSGSRLVATKRELDFTLLELRNNIAAVHRPFYAGWNTSTTAPQGVVGIHHPQGDVKKIAVANSTLVTGTFYAPDINLLCDANAHWIVRRWDEGVTEGGSSGSAIFDMEHKIVGTLSGGMATCANPVNDYYSKFSEQWNKYPQAETSLRRWLDPDNTGVTSLWGYDPITGFEGRINMLGNIGENENIALSKSQDWGYLTGQNDRGWISFAEKITNDSIANIIGMEVHVAKAPETGANVQFTVWHGTEFPVVPLITKNVVVTADYNDFPMHVYFDRMIEISGDFFIGYSLEYNNPLDTFAVYHSTIRPVSGVSAMYVQESNGTWMALEEYVPPIFASLGVRAMGRFSKQVQPTNRPSANKELKIIYLSGYDKLNIYIDDFEELSATSLTVEFFDTAGRLVLLVNDSKGRMGMLGNTVSMYVEANVGNLPPGVYLVQILDRNNRWSGRFVKMQ